MVFADKMSLAEALSPSVRELPSTQSAPGRIVLPGRFPGCIAIQSNRTPFNSSQRDMLLSRFEGRRFASPALLYHARAVLNIVREELSLRLVQRRT
jgi:hypothetical protein